MANLAEALKGLGSSPVGGPKKPKVVNLGKKSAKGMKPAKKGY